MICGLTNIRRQNGSVVSVRLVMMLLAAVVLCGCASGPWARVTPDDAVTRMFADNAVPRDYRYFVCGRTTMPYAIVGLDSSYAFDIRLWEEIGPETEKFAWAVAFVWDPHVWYQFDSARGSWILDSRGRKIGIWYSMYPRAAVRIDEQNRRVTAYCPHRAAEDHP